MIRSFSIGALGIVLLACNPIAAPNEVLYLEDAILEVGGAGSQEPVALPYHFNPRQRRSANHGVFRLNFTLDEIPSEPWAVYLAELRMNALVTVNGTKVGDGGSIREPVARNWNRPLLFPIPTERLRAGSNAVEVAVYASPTSKPRLSRVRVGPERLLTRVHDRAVLRHVTTREIAVVFLILIAVSTAVVAQMGAAPRSSLWLAATAIFIALGQLDGIVRDIPVATSTWQVLNTCAYLAGIVCFVASMHRLVGHRAVRFERILIGVAVLLVAALAFSEPPYFVLASTAILSSSAALLLYALWRAYSAGGGSTRVGIAALSICVLGLGAVDAAHAFFSGTGEGPRASGLVPVAFAIFAGWMLLENLRLVLDRNDLLNGELDRRVAQSEDALARSHAHVRSMERGHALMEERGRLIREMHDGLGALLVSTLALVEGGERNRRIVADALREILDEMRFMLDSLEPEESDLVSVLGRIRNRFSPRLERAGLTVDWRLPYDTNLAPLEPGTLHDVIRIVQEAIVNALRHAGARTISIRTEREGRHETSGIVLEIIDDGVGMTREALASKRGIAHMRRRANDIGAHLEIHSGSDGTRVSLWVPSHPE